MNLIHLLAKQARHIPIIVIIRSARINQTQQPRTDLALILAKSGCTPSTPSTKAALHAIQLQNRRSDPPKRALLQENPLPPPGTPQRALVRAHVPAPHPAPRAPSWAQTASSLSSVPGGPPDLSVL